jgi:NitT/TauT family transport system substrate-binding protein
MLGYVFDEAWAAKNRDAIGRFLAVTRKAKDALASSDAEWQRIAPLVGISETTALKVLRDRYRAGIPRRPIADEEADARILYGVLAQVGGAELVGPADALAPGTYYRPGE